MATNSDAPLTMHMHHLITACECFRHELDTAFENSVEACGFLVMLLIVSMCMQTCAVLSPSVLVAHSCAPSMPVQALAFAQMPKVANSAFLEVSCTQP